MSVESDESRDYRVEQHIWESAPNPQFDYPDETAQQLCDGRQAIRQHLPAVLPVLSTLRNIPFFRYFAVDLLASCGYTPTHEEPCALDACEIDPAEDVPEIMRARDEDEYEFELDSWARWDMPSDYTEYFDLQAQSERHTEYDGSRVWRFIHQKICFQLAMERPQNGWKRDFNRAVSGMHACVSASIVADISTRDRDQAMAEYRRRLRDEPGAVTNLYFALSLVLCALSSIEERVANCNYMGDGEQVRPLVRELLDAPLLRDPAVQTAANRLRSHTTMSERANAGWQLRLRTRDLMGIMNCVQCNLCRLHGKVTVLGIAAALQALLGACDEEECELVPDPYSLHRTEVAALVVAAAKLASACDTVERMRQLDMEGAAQAAA